MTTTLAVDPESPSPEAVRRAADVLRAGGLVAFPTETVYGLGANALDGAAVGRIFAAKGRPASNPIIVHVASAEEASTVAAAWTDAATRLAARFWPGPLTLVLPKRRGVPDGVTAGGPTVAVRVPAHPVAAALLRAAGVPVAAPSANRSTELSPTRAAHVLAGLDGRIDLLLDGGPCAGGIESTVVDATGPVVRLLRPGLVSVPMLEEVVGRVAVGSAGEGVARSPGQMAKHYSPRVPLVLAATDAEAAELATALAREGLRVGSLSFAGVPPAEYARALYRRLHELDRSPIDRIVATLPPDAPEWAAVRDRLTRAAARG